MSRFERMKKNFIDNLPQNERELIEASEFTPIIDALIKSASDEISVLDNKINILLTSVNRNGRCEV